MTYDEGAVKQMLRRYSSLSSFEHSEWRVRSMDLRGGMLKLEGQYGYLYEAILGVYMVGLSVRVMAKLVGVSKSQMQRWLKSGITLLTSYMNQAWSYA